MPLVSLVDVHVSFGTTPVLAGIDLTLGEGERLGLAGPNGAGKTTLLGVMATLISPHRGRGEVLGQPIGTSETARARPQIGLCGHEPALYDELTLAENLRHFARLGGQEPEAADRALAAVGLAAASGRRADRSSNGMRRRADLARLLMREPRLVLLDEVHTGLDAGALTVIEAVCRRAVSAGGAVVLVSHDTELLGSRVDRVVTIQEGRIGG